MKLSDYKNEDALEVLADLLEPVQEILTDEGFKDIIKKGISKAEEKVALAKYLLKNHSKAIIAILARLNGGDKYEANIAEILTQVLDLINDKVLADFFVSQVQSLGDGTSLPATENTEEIGEA